MKASDIKIGHIYYVNYDPVSKCEFNGRHLSVVLKRNNDKLTFVVMPLTSSNNGDGINKKNIGKIAGLPAKLKSVDSYAVYDQVRTVNADRFFSIKDGSNTVDASLDNSLWLSLFELAMHDVLYNVLQDEKIALLKSAYDYERVVKAKDLAYNIIKLKKTITESEDKVAALKEEIKLVLKDVAYTLDSQLLADGIQDIFNDALDS
jgi:mRNA-degrading endonuclease toxin of MazEF toxin-antitoxin module